MHQLPVLSEAHSSGTTYLVGADLAVAYLAVLDGVVLGRRSLPVPGLLVLLVQLHAGLLEHLVLALLHPLLQQLLHVPLEVLEHDAHQRRVDLA